MDMLTATSLPRTRHSVTKGFLRLALSLSLLLLAAAQASAQYGGGMTGTGTPGTPGYVAPSNGYGSGKAIGIGVGAAAGAGAGVLFLALHHRGMVSGCVQPADDGLRLVDEKNKKSYILATNALILKPGQHVELKGQKSKNESGVQTFEARKLVKDLGSCGASASVAKTQPSGN